MQLGYLLSLVILCLSVPSLVARPANDDFAAAEILPEVHPTIETNFQVIVNLKDATLEAGESPSVGHDNFYLSVWYHFRPEVRGTLAFSFEKNAVVMQLYVGTNLTSLAVIDSRITSGTKSISLYSDQDYYIRVLSKYGDSFPLNFTFKPRMDAAFDGRITPHDGGRLEVEPSSPDNRYPANQIIRVTPVASPGYRFDGWKLSEYQNFYTPYEVLPDGSYLGMVPNGVLDAKFETLANNFATRKRLYGVSAHGSEFDHGTIELDEPETVEPRTLWWSWVAPHTGPATVHFGAYSLNAGETKTRQRSATGRVFEGQQLKFLTPVSGFGSSKIEFSAVAGREYNIQLSSALSAQLWVRFTQSPPIQPLAPHFSLDPSAPGYLYRSYYGEPDSLIPTHATEAEGLIHGWWKIAQSKYTNAAPSTPEIGRGTQLREGSYRARELYTFVELPAGPHTISFSSRNCALYAGANNVLISENQNEVTFESPGGVIPFRLVYWEWGFIWGLKIDGLHHSFDISEMAPAISYRVTPMINHVWTTVSTAEDAEGSENHAEITVHRSGGNDPLAVQFAYGGTAEAGVDYVALGNSVLIPTNEPSRKVSFIPVDDSLHEDLEYASFLLQTDGNYLLSTNMGVLVRMADNDPHTQPLEVSIVSPIADSRFVDPATLVFEFSVSNPAEIAEAELIYLREGETAPVKTGETNLPPFTLIRESMPAGVYDFQAVVHTFDGNSVTSSPVRIVVDPDPNFEAEPGLIHWWRAEDDARDAAGSSHGQALYGATYGPGKIGRAFQTFAGVFKFEVPSTVTTGLTVQAWVKGADYEGYILYKGSYGFYEGPSFQVTLENSILYAYKRPLSLHEWHLITGTYDGREARLYYDGQLVRTTAVAQATSLRQVDSPLIIGSYTDDPDVPYYVGQLGSWFDENFNGWIDEVKIYDRPLSPTEISAAFLDIRPPEFLLSPANETAEVGASVELSAVLSGTAPILLQWQRGSEVLPGETNATLMIPFLSPTNAGTYTLVASNMAGSISSSAVVTAVLPSVSISPDSVNLVEGGASDEVVFTRTGLTNYPLEVHYSIDPETAFPGDFVSLTGSVTIPVGEFSAGVLIPVQDDFEPEPVETAILLIETNANYVAGPTAGAVISIEDNDMADPTGLIGFWKFESDATDERRLNDGSVIPPLSFVPAADGLGLAPENGFVLVPYTHLLQPTNLTVQALVKHPQSVGAEAEYLVAMNPNGVNSAFEISLRDDRLHFVVVTSGGRFETSGAVSELFDDHYHSVTATYNGSVIQLFFDGVELSRADAHGRIVYELGGLEGLYIGDYSDGSIDPAPSPMKFNFAGIIDELKVHDRALPPIFIKQHPDSRIRSKGSPVTFEVSVTASADLSYQWQFNGSDLPGETNAVLALSSATESDAGIFQVIIQAGDQTILSNPAYLTILDLQLNGTEGRLLEVAGPSGSAYVIEYAEELSDTTEWVPLGEITIEDSPGVLTDPSTGQEKGFYRVRPK